MFQLRAVMFDHTVLAVTDQQKLDELRELLTELKRLGLKIGAFATRYKDMVSEDATPELTGT